MEKIVMRYWYTVSCTTKDGETYEGEYAETHDKQVLEWLCHDHKLDISDVVSSTFVRGVPS